MATSKANTLGLRAKKVEDLRGLAIEFLDLSSGEIAQMDRNSLVANISQAAPANPKLARELNKAEIAIKASFYLMVLASSDSHISEVSEPRRRLKRALAKRTTEITDGVDTPTYRGFSLEEYSETKANIAEAHLTWQRVHWYWDSRDMSLKHIYEGRFGLAILDFKARKALIACHTEFERDLIAKAVGEAYSVRLTPMVLTQQLLNQIGSFDQVKRAGYFISQKDARTPTIVAYADDDLAAKQVAREEEMNPRSQRKHSFYRIPLGSVLEQGVGATSDSGKLWIPRELPLSTVRDYGIALLKKIGGTIAEMAERREIENVVGTMNIAMLAGISSIPSLKLRNHVGELLLQLANMLIKDDSERPFTPPMAFPTEGVPLLFNYPRLLVTDSETGDVAFWRDSNSASQLINITQKKGGIVVRGVPSHQQLDLSDIIHPITGAAVALNNPLDVLELTPTPRLLEILMEAIRLISNQFPDLRRVVDLPFYITSGVLRLDLRRAFGHPVPMAPTEIQPTEVRELRQAITFQPTPFQRTELKRELMEYGEKCTSMNDENCQTCISDKRFICLRSLVARYLKNTLVLAHKGIELSDIQGRITVGNEELSVFGFAKLPESKTELTARNKAGAILLAQVLGQIDKTTFNTVMIISPAVLNEDLRERLRLLCSIFGKRLLILNLETLAKMLLHFKEQAAFEKIDLEKLRKESKRKPRPSKTRKAA